MTASLAHRRAPKLHGVRRRTETGRAVRRNGDEGLGPPILQATRPLGPPRYNINFTRRADVQRYQTLLIGCSPDSSVDHTNNGSRTQLDVSFGTSQELGFGLTRHRNDPSGDFPIGGTQSCAKNELAVNDV
jgi:hypothetical protein